MRTGRTSHDDRLLDALAELPETSFRGILWRVVNAIRSPIDGSRGAGRWNHRESEVLYCALQADGALSEIHFHINRGNTIFPSKLKHRLHKMRGNFDKVLDLSDPKLLAKLGVDMSRYEEILPAKTQEIGEAARFLGFEAMIVPNARHRSSNLLIFVENVDLDMLELEESTAVDWSTWRAEQGHD